MIEFFDDLRLIVAAALTALAIKAVPPRHPMHAAALDGYAQAAKALG